LITIRFAFEILTVTLSLKLSDTMSEAGESLTAFTSQHSTRRNFVWTITSNDEATQLGQLAELVKLESEKPELADILEKVKEGGLKGFSDSGASIYIVSVPNATVLLMLRRARVGSSFLLSSSRRFGSCWRFTFLRTRGIHPPYPSSRHSTFLFIRRSRSLDCGRRYFPSWPKCRSRTICKVTQR
jgi:hypothetical protein